MIHIMNSITCSMYIFILCICNLHLFAVGDNGSFDPTENIVLNCGSNMSEFVQNDGRNWSGDIASPYVPSNAETKSRNVRAPDTLQSIPEVPYLTARIFQSQFTYSFNVTPGPKFIRLHFYPASYSDLNISNAFLSVSAANFTLLHNFSASLNADYFNLAYFMKEFIVHVSGSVLQLTFAPTYNASDAFAFVNGIEVVSMPLGLYIRGDDSPLLLVDHGSKVFYIYNDSAMENLYRLNVGGGEQIPPKYDTGMFRTWNTDEVYILGAYNGIEPSNMSMPVLYSHNAPPYSAPANVYRTSRSMTPFDDGLVNLNYNLTWFFPVDSGFLYLVRLHFCEIDHDITGVNQVVFTVFLNNQTADEAFDVIAWSGEPGSAIYQDYVVMVPRVEKGKQDLWLDLHPNKESKPMYYNAFLNGVEIFKLSNFGDKNLAGLNPSHSFMSGSEVKAPRVVHKKKLKFILVGCGLGIVVLSILLCLVVLYKLKNIRPRRVMSWCGLAIHSPYQTGKAKKSSLCTYFSLREIKVATNDFDEALLTGIGGFGSVFKGSFDGGATYVAIKRANPKSEQGVSEFETEILLLSQLRHHNLASLLGYCNEDGEMILVYDFMANGSLYDHLHLRKRDQSPLAWIQRLEICIGVARGLHYLHTGTKQRIVHRDIKTTNILLDHNWVPKISDFGLSKAGYSFLVSANVKGSIGYLDPECYQSHKLSEKSDIYSLGVVLLEILTARPAVSVGEDDEHINLAEWTMLCFESGNVEQIVDPNLKENIIKECFELYIGVAMKCLAERGVERPSIGEVLENLVLAMHFQKNEGTEPDGNVHTNDNAALQGNSDLTPGVEFSEIMMPIAR